MRRSSDFFPLPYEKSSYSLLAEGSGTDSSTPTTFWGLKLEEPGPHQLSGHEHRGVRISLRELLELHPFVEQAPWAFGYVGLNGDATKGTERKLSGSYYTPDSLVQEPIKSALEPVIRKTATDHPYDQRVALLSLKVVDPACGSGHFLLAAARRIASEIARIEAAPDAPTEAQRQRAPRGRPALHLRRR